MNKEEILKAIEGKLIVSCQALEDEPLHGSETMGKMAYAASLAGAGGIRANTVEDIREIKKKTDLPIIGIIKKEYEGSEVYITPSLKEVDALYKEGVEIIAIDATRRLRPDGKTISEAFPEIREKYKDQLFMADCSNYEEAVEAARLGFDFVGTTMHGYTDYTRGVELPNFELIDSLVRDLDLPIIAEGGIWSGEDLRKVFELGVHTAVVGSAITRPLEITKKFLAAIE